MESSSFNHPSVSTQSAGVYNDLNGLQSIKTEKDGDVALKKVAQQFESLFFDMLLKNMRKANEAFEKDSIFSSNESKMYRDMYDKQLSLTLGTQSRVGIADTLYRQLKGAAGVSREDYVDRPEGYPIDNSPKSYALDQGKDYVLEKKKTDFTLEPKERLFSLEGVARSATTFKLSEVRNKPIDKSSPAAEEITATQPVENFSPNTPREFVEGLLPYAKAAAKKIGLNPLVMIAQAALETGWGKHIIKNEQGDSSNNLFNIKADSRWSGDQMVQSTLEFINGIPEKQLANFRRYGSIGEAASDFISFIQENSRYENALSASGDEQQFVQELQRAGYATDPQYSEKILRIFDQLKRDEKIVDLASE